MNAPTTTAEPLPCSDARLDLDQARRFLEVMTGGEPVTFQTFDDDEGRKDRSLAHILHGVLDECAPALRQLNARGAGIFWMVNYGDGKGRTAAHVTGVRALFVDLDGAPLAPVLAAGVEPHAVVESSPGKWHAYWCVTGCSTEMFKPAQRAMAALFGGDKNVNDLPRVLRVPGFLHSKGEPFTVRVESAQPMQPYPFDELVQRLGLDLAAPRRDAAAGGLIARGASGGHQFADKVRALGRRLRQGDGRREMLKTYIASRSARGVQEDDVRLLIDGIASRYFDPADPVDEKNIVRIVEHFRRAEAAQQKTAAADDEVLPAPFAIVPVADLADAEPAAPTFWWDGYVPAGVVTLLTGHGGGGKSTVALMLCASVALGRPLFGIPTRPGNVLFYSAEDGAHLVRHRLHRICGLLGVEPAYLDGRLHILDATSNDPTLFHEVSMRGGARIGTTTATFAALQEYIEQHAIDVLIVDNASDAYDASEIDRSRVRGFMRALARIAQRRQGAVLLLAHVDKGTSRGERSGTESYSGSTAW